MTKDEQRFFICYFGEQLAFWFRRFELTRCIDDFERAERFADELKEYLPLFIRDILLENIVGLIEGMLAGTPNKKD